MDNSEKLATQTKKDKQKHNTICVGHNYTQANTNNLNHDTWLTVTEYLCYTSPRICHVILSSSGEETDYRSGIPESPGLLVEKNDQHRQIYLVATRENIVSGKMLCEAHIKIFECLIDNVFAMLDEHVFQQTVDTPQGTNFAPLNTDFFIYLHEGDVDAGTSQKKRKQLVRSFNFTIL